MAEIITTLHPENDENTDLYPNIKNDNIPNNSITIDKMAYDDFQSLVDEWLDNHPEATTSVLDHSLTYEKLVNGTLGFVIPEMFGAIGDGVTDDTDAINSAISFCEANKTYLLLVNRYLISDTINITFSGLRIEGSSIKCGFIQSDSSKDIICYSRTYQTEFYGEILKNLFLTYSTYGDVDTVGIRFMQTGDTYDLYGTHDSIFENIRISKAYYGVYSGSNEPIWNVTFNRLSVLACQYSALRILNGFNNYIEILVKDASPSAVTRGRCIQLACGGTLNLDVEDWTGTILYDENAFSPLHITKAHIERCTLSANYGAFLSFGNTPITIDEILIYKCTISSANYGNAIKYYGVGGNSTSTLIVGYALAYNNTVTGNFCVIATTGTDANLIELKTYNSGFNYGYYPYGAFTTNCWLKNVLLS